MDVGMEVWRFWDNMYICSHVWSMVVNGM
jgi:hypothetical protein